MSTDTILLIGFALVIYNLWGISNTLIRISSHLSESNTKLKEVNDSFSSSDLKSLQGSKYVDLTKIGEYLEDVGEKLKDIENAVNSLDKPSTHY